MSDPEQIAMLRAVIWLLRIAMHPTLTGTLQRDAVVFAAWYAAAGPVLDWPEEVARIQRTERARRLSLERMMKLLSQIDYTLSGRTSAQHARLVLEGYAVHEWVSRNGAAFASLAKASRLIGASSTTERDRIIVQAVRRSQRALARNLAERLKPPVTQYSLEYLNTAGRFTPKRILESLRRRPKGSMLLYGPPGTGKTQFTEHLATELRLPLVSKSASALLSKWVGESEKNIAAAFEEAAAEEAILFFDEGDSFLRSRELAVRSWEVTQTNELLQHMERYDGIVVVATNLFRDLDMAALRRFTTLSDRRVRVTS